MAEQIPATRKRNVLWPIRRDGKGWNTGTLAARYRSALRHLIKTPVGSIVWAPGFGSRLHEYRTQIADLGMVEALTTDIAGAIARWIPDIALADLTIDRNPETEELTIEVTWGIPDGSPALSGEPSMPEFVYGPINETITI